MKTALKNTLSFATVYGINLVGIISAKAALIDPQDQPSDTMGGDFRSNVVHIINYLLTFLGLAAVAFIVYAGFLMVTAGGDDGQLEKGKNVITWAVIGIVIILLSYGIVNVVVGVGENAVQ